MFTEGETAIVAKTKNPRSIRARSADTVGVFRSAASFPDEMHKFEAEGPKEPDFALDYEPPATPPYEGIHPGVLYFRARTEERLAQMRVLEASQIADPELGPLHRDTLRTGYLIALDLHALGRNDEALAKARRIESDQGACLAYERHQHPDTLLTGALTAQILAALGQRDEALLKMWEVEKALSEHPARGPSHSDTQMSFILLKQIASTPGRNNEGATLLPLDSDQSLSAQRSEDSAPLEKTLGPANIPAHVNIGAVLVPEKSIITRGGVRYLPLPLAAWNAQASESSLRNWIDNRVKFAGRIIKTHLSITKGVYVSEESVQRMSERFIKWPSREPAGQVTLGETDDQSGFLGTSDAARIVGVSSRTMWLWASQGKAPTAKCLDVIKCTTSDYFYIREKDVFELRAGVPRSGLQRGRRPFPVAKP